jgi:hypothetical protein
MRISAFQDDLDVRFLTKLIPRKIEKAVICRLKHHFNISSEHVRRCRCDFCIPFHSKRNKAGELNRRLDEPLRSGF